MAKRLVLGALLGGLVLFVWGAISWMVLPWHEAALNRFTDEDAVASTITASAPRPGIYVYPGMPPADGSPEERAAAEQASMAKMERGPIIFVSYDPAGMTSMAMPMICNLLTQILGALLVTWLLNKTSGLSYWGAVLFVVVAALAAGVVAVLPEWIWWHFSTTYVMGQIADLVIGGFLSGLVIAKVGRP